MSEVTEEIHFEGAGCAISTASASIMTEALKGKTPGKKKHASKRGSGTLEQKK